jgi:hypothetical protein
MRRSSYALMLLLYVAALALPALTGLVCMSGPAGGEARHGKGQRGHCPLATCGSGPGIVCRTVF